MASGRHVMAADSADRLFQTVQNGAVVSQVFPPLITLPLLSCPLFHYDPSLLVPGGIFVSQLCWRRASPHASDEEARNFHS